MEISIKVKKLFIQEHLGISICDVDQENIIQEFK